MIFGALFVRVAVASTVLPDSDYYQGRSYFGEWTQDGFLEGHVDFAVYDTDESPDQFVGGGGFADTLSWWSESTDYRYLYAYQIFNDETSGSTLDYFGIKGMGDGALVRSQWTDEFPMGSVDDGTDGIEPGSPYPSIDPNMSISGMSGVVWEFDEGLLTAGEHSWFLVIGSDSPWKAGSYVVQKDLNTGLPVLGENALLNAVSAPEPATIALLGIGSAIVLAGRKKSKSA